VDEEAADGADAEGLDAAAGGQQHGRRVAARRALGLAPTEPPPPVFEAVGEAVAAVEQAISDAVGKIANLGKDLSPEEKKQAAPVAVAVIISQVASAAVAAASSAAAASAARKGK
jgi:hypothetical protein